jgi:hypothetical protein
VFRLGWQGEYHRRPGTTGFGLAHCWNSPPRGLPTPARWIEGGFLRGFSLNDAAASNHVVPAWAQILLFGRKTTWGRYGCAQELGDAILVATLPLLALSSGGFCPFPFNASAIVGSVFDPAAAAFKLLL